MNYSYENAERTPDIPGYAMLLGMALGCWAWGTWARLESADTLIQM